MKEAKQDYISTDVKNLWKGISILKHHALEFLPAQERMFCALWFRAAHLDLQDHVPLNQTAWILAHCQRRSKQKMNEDQY